MLEVFQNKCLRIILHIFWPNKITNALRANWDAAHLVRVKDKKMEVDWPCQQNATDIYSQSSHALGPLPEIGGGDDQKRRGEGPWSER